LTNPSVNYLACWRGGSISTLMTISSAFSFTFI
jgi:hypothetical protein